MHCNPFCDRPGAVANVPESLRTLTPIRPLDLREAFITCLRVSDTTVSISFSLIFFCLRQFITSKTLSAHSFDSQVAIYHLRMALIPAFGETSIGRILTTLSVLLLVSGPNVSASANVTRDEI